MIINTILVDDERKARELLTHLLGLYCPTVNVVAGCSSVPEAVPLIEKHHPDLVFLDVEMPEASGFELFRGDKAKTATFETIFTTAHSHYAVDAFNVNASGYLLKPVVPEALVKTVTKTIERIEHKKNSHTHDLLLEQVKKANDVKRIGIPALSGVTFVEVDKIIRCEASSNYTVIHFYEGNKMVVTRTLKEFEAILSPYHFCRIHKSHIISLKHIASYHKAEASSLILTDGTTLPVGSQMRSALDRQLKII
jgi:two-component system, LytTR family, response regulator